MPNSLAVQSILALSDPFRESRELRYRQIKKSTDLKIRMLVLQQIVQAIEKKNGALFPSATVPRIVIGQLSTLHPPRKTREERMIPSKPRSPRPTFRAVPSRRIPIGLNSCEPHNWINSLIQFLLFLPGSWELFSLVPRSSQPLREFVDQYFADQEENRPVSSADSREVVRYLIRKLPIHLLQNKQALYDILAAFMKTLFSCCPFAMPGEIHPVVLHPEWHVVSNSDEFEAVFKRKLSESPPEILVGFIGASLLLQGHYFASSNGASYDLDAFIERRPDGENGEHSIAYLKQGGAWYQCDDDRIVRFPSNCLNAPLRQATLLHYKRVELNNTNYQK